MGLILRMTGRQHAEIADHVLSPDGKEAGSLLLCTPVFRGDNAILLVKRIINIPYDACTKRSPTYLSWPTEEFLAPLYEVLEKESLSLVMLHSHPTGFEAFSDLDDQNDLKILPRLTHCIEGAQPHGSAIMLPTGAIKARVFGQGGEFTPIDKIIVAGEDIRVFTTQIKPLDVPEYIEKSAQVYGAATTNIMRRLKIGVVGCSGTGSPLIELLLRYHVGELVLIDFDSIEEGNLNRMLMSRVRDVNDGRLKVERYADWISESGLPTDVQIINDKVPSDKTTDALAECDIIFGCVDNAVARHALNKIACSYLIPYFDLGVAIKPDKKNGGVRQAVARCHYLQPDQSCLLDRDAFSAERLRDENFRRDDPDFYKELKAAGYTQDADDIQAVMVLTMQAVMVLTMQAAVLGVDDLMARIGQFRVDSNRIFDEQERSFTHGYYNHQEHSSDNVALRAFIGVGDNHKKM